MSKSFAETILELEKSLEPNDASEIDKYEIGTDNLKSIQSDYEKYTSSMYKCIDDLYNKPGTDSYMHSKDHLVNVLLPQLRFINELTHVVNSFPHKKLPSTTAFLGEMMERAKYKMANIKNFDAVVGVSSLSGVMPSTPAPGIVPYQQINGGRTNEGDYFEDSDDDLDRDDYIHYSHAVSDKMPGDYMSKLVSRRNPEKEESDDLEELEKEKPKKKKHTSKKSSMKNPEKEKSGSDDDKPVILLDTSSEEEPAKSLNSSSSTSSSTHTNNSKKHKNKKSSKSKPIHNSSSSSSPVFVEQAGGMKRIKRKIRRTKN